MAKVLMVDDGKLIVEGTKFSLEQDGMDVECAYGGGEAINLAKEKEFDVVLLDVMLPKFNGCKVRQATREFSEVPIIMLIAKGNDMDKVLELEYGADNYITRPFNILKVKARIKTILRRNSKRSKKAGEVDRRVIASGGPKPDRDSRRAFVGDKEINLTVKELDLLELLVCNPDKVYSREALLSYVWGNKANDSGDVRMMDVHVRRLREKIEPSPNAPQYVHTKWGVGYYFRA